MGGEIPPILFFMYTVKADIFEIEFNHPHNFQVDQILESSGGKLTVIKVYRLNWWRKLLKRLKFKTKENRIKVALYKI